MAASDSTTLSNRPSSRRFFNGAPISLPAAWVNAWRLAEFTPDVAYYGDPRAPMAKLELLRKHCLTVSRLRGNRRLQPSM